MQERKLTIFFTSDLHSYIYPTDYRSQAKKELGLFKCASQFQKDGNTLIIDGGDLLQGSPLGAFCHDTVGSAAQFAQIMNRCGYDYVTLVLSRTGEITNGKYQKTRRCCTWEGCMIYSM